MLLGAAVFGEEKKKKRIRKVRKVSIANAFMTRCV